MKRGKINYGREVDFNQFNWSEDKINNIERHIEEVESYLQKEINEVNFQSLCDLIYYLIDKIPLPVHNLDTTFIIRARPNYAGEVFKEKSDISYNTKNIDRIKPGRFNRPFESMFYAAVPTGEQRQLIMTVSLECCKDLIDDNNSDTYQYLTFGKWFLKERFPVIFMCFEDEVKKKIKNIDNVINNYFTDFFGDNQSNIKTLIEKFWKFISKYSSQQATTPQHYFITSAFFLMVREYYKEINGILYPSSMTKSDGLNLVLTPTAVDKYLELREIFMYKFQRHPNNKKSYNSNIVSDIANCSEGLFSFSSIW